MLPYRVMERGKKERLDVLVVAEGLAESREVAQRFIRAGEILVDEERIDKPGTKINPGAAIRSKAKRQRFVSRAGDKLEAALAAWGIDVSCWVCVDLGASTGGFCDCLLQRGAARVHAVDVGAGQLHEKIRTDPRIAIHDRVNARLLTPGEIGEPARLVTGDLSFISIRLVLPAVRGLLERNGMVVVLVKPQFEIGKGRVGKGGIVRNPEHHREVLNDFVRWAVEDGWGVAGLESSPILGREGNREFLAHLFPDSMLGLPAERLRDAIDSLTIQRESSEEESGNDVG